MKIKIFIDGEIYLVCAPVSTETDGCKDLCLTIDTDETGTVINAFKESFKVANCVAEFKIPPILE